MDRFSIFVIIRVILLVLMCLIFGMIFGRSDYLFSQVIVGLMILIVSFEMINFTRRSIRELSKFIMAVKYGDVSVNFSDDRLGPVFRNLANSFREVISAFHQVKIEKESQFQLLQAIIDKISFGIIVVNQDDAVLLINQSALDVLGMERTRDWKNMQRQNIEFTRQVENMGDHGRKLIELDTGLEIRQLSVYHHSLVILEKTCRVITFYDIQEEIEQKEIEAWHKLIRILTHEIMNSATPLVSLTETILMLLEDEQGAQKKISDISERNVKDIRTSVNTIKNRSEGMLQFVEAYRKLTDIPHPEVSKIHVHELFGNTVALLETEFKKRDIACDYVINPENLQLSCDRNLMEQVMINLLTNSMYALENYSRPAIRMSAFKKDNRTVLIVEDNGKGIPEDSMKKIFIPFYSTRQGGSGIGLSFSKFVIIKHGGRIKVESERGKFTRCIIDLPEN